MSPLQSQFRAINLSQVTMTESRKMYEFRKRSKNINYGGSEKKETKKECLTMKAQRRKEKRKKTKKKQEIKRSQSPSNSDPSSEVDLTLQSLNNNTCKDRIISMMQKKSVSASFVSENSSSNSNLIPCESESNKHKKLGKKENEKIESMATEKGIES